MVVTVERKRALQAPPQRIITALQDAANLEVLMPRIERSENWFIRTCIEY